MDRIAGSFAIGYGSAAEAFWSSNPAPSTSLCAGARQYVLEEDYTGFFAPSDGPDRLRHGFRSRLIALRRNLADHIIRSDYDLETAASRAPASRKLDASERLLFFSWSLLQAFYGIADDGRVDDAVDDDDEGEQTAAEANDDYFRTLASASVKLLDVLGTPGDLKPKQVDVVRTRLKTALRHKGAYQPPVLVWKLKSDGRRRRVFASLRLFAYARLLRATAESS